MLLDLNVPTNKFMSNVARASSVSFQKTQEMELSSCMDRQPQGKLIQCLGIKMLKELFGTL